MRNSKYRKLLFSEQISGIPAERRSGMRNLHLKTYHKTVNPYNQAAEQGWAELTLQRTRNAEYILLYAERGRKCGTRM